MAVGARRVTWSDLSPSCQSAFSWAAAAAGPSNKVGSAALLVGIVRAHEGTSHPEALLRVTGGRTRADLFRALEKTEEGVLRPTIKTPQRLRELPDLSAAALRVLEEGVILGDDFPARDGKVHLQHLFGGILSAPQTAAHRTLSSLVARDVAGVRKDYLGYLAAQMTNPSLTYDRFLESRRPSPTEAAVEVAVPDLFVGREAEREAAEKALRSGRSVLLVGPAGIGKSALANVVANDVRADFPDGVYIAAMQGRDANAVAAELIGGAEPGEATAQYHAFLQGKKALLVLHDAGPGAEQLMPPPPSAAIVTSRVPLQLPAETISLAPLAEEDVRPLLEELGITVSPDEIPAIAQVTLMSPLNLRLLGELWAEGVALDELRRLADELRGLGEASSAAVDSNLDAAYQSLAPDERALFRRIGLLEGSFAPPEAGAVADTSLEHAQATLEHLASLALVIRNDDGQYELHPATRAYARARIANEEDAVAQREGALRALAAARGIGLATRFTPALAGHVADTPSKIDHLDFDPDVEALCSVLVAKDVEPPISVGLFGDWGTGKSTFMWLMRERVRQLANEWRDRKDPLFCVNVKQITFNAWHYSDANLWASIATRIFEGLAQPDPEVEDDDALSEAELAAVAGELETAKLQVTEKERELEEARARESVLEERRKQLRDDETDVLARLSAIEPDDILRDAAADPGVRALAAKLDQELGGAGGDAIAAARNLTFVGGRLRMLWRRLPHRRLLILGCLLALVLLGVGIWVAVVSGWLAAVPIGVIGAWIAAAAAVVGPPLRRVRTAAATAREYLARLEERQAARRRVVEVAIQQELAQLAARRTQIEHDLDAARLDAERAEREIDDIRTGRRLARFVEERAASADYAAYLGLIALIRRDFDRLRFLLRESTKAERPKIDRIILYIDDLDRCPASRVVEVLEAVHLLLALDLFVVVVGVDPRWLVTSLERHYSAQLGQGNGDSRPLPLDLPDEWATTPQNYLEKIFQIPLAIRPMGKRGFERLVGSLLDVRAPEPSESEPPPTPEPEEQLPETAPPPFEHRDEAQQRTAPDPELQRERLTVWDAELQFLKKLAPLVPTPRAAKRLANTYRLVRASLDARALRNFVRDEGRSGDYQAALILLGILIGAPADAGTVFRAIADAQEEDLETFVGRVGNLGEEDDEDEIKRLTELQEKLERVLRAASPVKALKPYKDWASRISRYSFETGRQFVAEPPERPADHAPA